MIVQSETKCEILRGGEEGSVEVRVSPGLSQFTFREQNNQQSENIFLTQIWFTNYLKLFYTLRESQGSFVFTPLVYLGPIFVICIRIICLCSFYLRDPSRDMKRLDNWVLLETQKSKEERHLQKKKNFPLSQIFRSTFLDTHVSLAPTHVRCPSVRPLVILSNFYSISVSGRST